MYDFKVDRTGYDVSADACVFEKSDVPEEYAREKKN